MAGKKKFDIIKLSELKPSEYNPRIMSESEEKKLSDNLDEFGLVDPIIINLKNNHIIGGHQRYSVLKEKYGGDVDFTDPDFYLVKLGDIGWVFEETSLEIKDDNHEKLLNVALNKIQGEWDYTKLSDLLGELTETHINMDLSGFDKIEINSMLSNIEMFEFEDESYYEEIDEEDSYDDEGDDEVVYVVDDDEGDEVVEDEGDNICKYTVRFNSQIQQQNFFKLLNKLKENYDDVVDGFIDLLSEKNRRDTFSINGNHYTLIFEDVEKYETFLNLLDEIEELPQYKKSSLLECCELSL